MTGKSIPFRQPTATPEAAADDWVQHKVLDQPKLPLEPMKRLTVDIPKALHTRIKSTCAIDDRQMNDVVREILEKAYPAA